MSDWFKAAMVCNILFLICHMFAIDARGRGATSQADTWQGAGFAYLLNAVVLTVLILMEVLP